MGSIFWFRRDLRLADNPALAAALDEGPTYPVFVIDPRLWSPAGARRKSYLAASLRRLSRDIEELGGPGLTVLVGDPVRVLPAMATDLGATIYATADFGPYGAARDEALARRASARFLDSPFLHVPGAVRKQDGGPYRVFTPFWRAWSALPAPHPSPRPDRWPRPPGAIPTGSGWQTLRAWPDPPFAVGEAAALRRWLEFADHRMATYGNRRDFPAADATSGLSAALKYGEIHPRTVIAQAAGREGGDAFVRQLCWRDFYGHLLADLPHTARRNYQAMFDAMPWREGSLADADFERWRSGTTGYPFVDAGMRHLAATGTMPNRLRMVVASFLVKDLRIDWRRGAAHFMRELYDGDLANNSHGWQWTAGTGTDAAPYYRIFNPVAQGLRFDPDGSYVRAWVPELAALGGPAAHEPWKHPRALWPNYPDRIVDHAAAREAALASYAEIRRLARVSATG